MDSPSSNSLFYLTSDLIEGQITIKDFLDNVSTKDFSSDEVSSSLAYLASYKNKAVSDQAFEGIITTAKSKKVNLKDISYTAVANSRGHEMLLRLINEEGVDVNRQNPVGGKTIFTQLIEQYIPLKGDKEFLRQLISKNCVKGLEGGLGNLFLFALQEENYNLLPGGYQSFKDSFGTGLTHRDDGVATPLVKLFSNPEAMDELLKRYKEKIDPDCELKNQLNNIYKTYTASATLALPEAKEDGRNLETGEPLHTPDRYTLKREEREELTPERSVGIKRRFNAISPAGAGRPEENPDLESGFSAISPVSAGRPEENPGTIVSQSRSIWQKLCDCLTKGGRG